MKREGTVRNNRRKNRWGGVRIRPFIVKGFTLLMILALTLTAVLPAHGVTGALTVYAAEEESIPPQDAEASEVVPAADAGEHTEEENSEEDTTLPEEETSEEVTETEEETVTDGLTDTEEESADDATVPAQEEVTVEDIVPDVPGEEQEATGEEETEELMEVAEELPVSEDPLGNIHGEAYTEKPRYYATFVVNSDIEGNQQMWSTCVTNITYNGSKIGLTGKAPVGRMGSFTLSVSWDGPLQYSEMMKQLKKAVGDKGTLVGWHVYTDGFATTDADAYNPAGYDGYCVTLDENALYYETSDGHKELFYVHGNRDYLFVAQITKQVAENISVTTVPAVTYDGREHVLIGSKINAKKQSADLRLEVFNTNDGTSLVMGKDYSVSYKNNKKASMYITDDGRYINKSTDHASRPHAVLTGKGKYQGFTAIVYFDILPQNLGATEYRADGINRTPAPEVSAPYTSTTSEAACFDSPPDTTCILKNGRLTKKINTKVVKTYHSLVSDAKGRDKYYYTTATLQQGTDYDLEVYRWNTTKYCWDDTGLSDPNGIQQAGDYLLVIRGKGDYCGIVYRSGAPEVYEDTTAENNAFRPDFSGDPTPYWDLDDDFQFRVTENNADFDLSRAKVSIKKKSINYNGEVHFDASEKIDDFGITVKMGKKELKWGTDYEVHLEPMEDSPSGNIVRGANEYLVHIAPATLSQYYGSLSENYVRIKGIKLTASMFKVTPGTVSYLDGNPVVEITAAGEKKGLSFTGNKNSNPYYVALSGPFTVNETYETAWMATKAYFEADGRECGEAIERSSGVKLNYRMKGLTLKDAVQKGLISFESKSSAVEYGAKGVAPGTIGISTGTMSGLFFIDGKQEQEVSISRSGDRDYYAFYDGDGNFVGSAWLTFQTTVASGKVKITVKAAGMFTGSYSFDGPAVSVKNVSSVGGYAALSEIDAPVHGEVYAVITDAKQGKNQAANDKLLGKPAVKLYECYEDAKGQMKFAAIPASEYQLEAQRVYDKYITTKVIIKSGAEKRYSFGAGVGIFGGTRDWFSLYQGKVPANKVTQVQWILPPKPQPNICGKGERPAYAFTGGQIRPLINEITIGGETFYNGPDFYVVSYGQNVKAGKGSGSITIRFCCNAYNDTYRYSGTLTFKFDITSVSGSM